MPTPAASRSDVASQALYGILRDYAAQLRTLMALAERECAACPAQPGSAYKRICSLLEPMLRELERMVGSAEIERCLEESRVRRFH